MSEQRRTSVRSSGLRGVADIFGVASTLWRDFVFGDRSADSTTSDLAGPTLGDVDVLGTANKFIRSLQPRTGPELDFLHVLLPHHPWHYLPTGQDYASLLPAPGIAPDFTWANRWSAAAARQRNLLQVQAADAVLGHLVRRLRQLHDYDATTLVVTGDHGVAFDAGESVRGVETGNYPEIMWTPLFIKRAGQVHGVVDDDPARIVDVLPTIAEIQGSPLPFVVDGQSLLHPRPPVVERPIFRWATNPEAPPPGSNYLHFDGPSGFASVLRDGIPAAPGDDLLAYRLGDHGDLVGRRVADVGAAAPDRSQVKLFDPEAFTAVNPKSCRRPVDLPPRCRHQFDDRPADRGRGQRRRRGYHLDPCGLGAGVVGLLGDARTAAVPARAERRTGVRGRGNRRERASVADRRCAVIGSPRRRTVVVLLLITIGVLGIRVAYTIDRASKTDRFYDWVYYRGEAAALADGRGFTDPGLPPGGQPDPSRPSADHPPLFSLLLAPMSGISGNSNLALRLFNAVVGSLGVFLIGLLGLEIGRGKRESSPPRSLRCIPGSGSTTRCSCPRASPWCS